MTPEDWVKLEHEIVEEMMSKPFRFYGSHELLKKGPRYIDDVIDEAAEDKVQSFTFGEMTIGASSDDNRPPRWMRRKK